MDILCISYVIYAAFMVLYPRKFCKLAIKFMPLLFIVHSPIMEGSNEESDPSAHSHHHTQHSAPHAQHSAFHPLGDRVVDHSHPDPHVYHVPMEEPPAEHDQLNHSSHIVDTSTYQPPEESPGLADQSVYIDTSNPFDVDTVRHILEQLPTPIKLHPSYHEVPRQIQSIICGINITLGM